MKKKKLKPIKLRKRRPRRGKSVSYPGPVLLESREGGKGTPKYLGGNANKQKSQPLIIFLKKIHDKTKNRKRTSLSLSPRLSSHRSMKSRAWIAPPTKRIVLSVLHWIGLERPALSLSYVLYIGTSSISELVHFPGFRRSLSHIGILHESSGSFS